MKSTTLGLEKGTERTGSTDCENDDCDGPDSDTLPCFACFDPDHEYGMEVAE